MGDPYEILVIGDSVGTTSHYPQHLETTLTNRNISADVTDWTSPGRTSSYAVSAAARIATMENPPDLVIIELGGNDLLGRMAPSTTRQNLENAIQSLQGQGIEVMLAGIQAPRYFPKEYRDEFNSIVPDLARKYGLVNDPLFLEPVVRDNCGMSPRQIFNAASMNGDMIHPNNLGGRQIAERMAYFVESALEISNAPVPAGPRICP